MLGELALVGYRKVNCSACEVIYQCTNYRSTYLNWELLLNSNSAPFSLNTHWHPEGTIIISHVGPHPVKYEVISANTTFVRATVTMDPVELNGTTIICNGITTTLSTLLSSKCMLLNINI